MALWGPKRKRIEALEGLIREMVQDAMPLAAIHRVLTSQRKIPDVCYRTFWLYSRRFRDAAWEDMKEEALKTGKHQQHRAEATTAEPSTKPKWAARPSAARKMKKFVRYKILTDEDTD